MSKVDVAVGDIWWLRVNNKIIKREITYISEKAQVIGFAMEDRSRWIPEKYDVREVEFIECISINELPPHSERLIQKRPSVIPKPTIVEVN